MSIVQGRQPGAVQGAALALARGELVAFPTETVYGLGARADDDVAVARIFAAKQRPSGHPLIVHLARPGDAEAFAERLGLAARRLMEAFWPGPVTVIVPRKPGIATAAAGAQASIGLRMPAHPLAQELLHRASELGVPGVAAPSANRFGRVSATTADHVAAEFGSGLLVLDGGPCPVGIESAIIDCTRDRPALLRPGALSRTQIEHVLGQALAEPDGASPRASGTLASHYAPGVPLRLFGGNELRQALAARAAGAGPGVLAVYSRAVPPAGAGCIHQCMPDDPTAVAHELFAVLRDLDTAGVAAIWVERPPPGPEWDGVRDRLQRAAA